MDPDVAEMRAAGAIRAGRRPRGPALASVRELAVGGVPARLYCPREGVTDPLVVYAHGGGWTIGSLDTHDRVCRRLAAGADAAVLSLGYRLAPEHPWPAAVDDVCAAVRSSRAELAPHRLAVAGDSAGGTLATLACVRLRGEAPEALPQLQLLICPNTDLAGAEPSMREKATGFALTAADVEFFNRQWVPDRDRWGDPGNSPLRVRDLSGLPAAVVITAEHDPLRDQGEAYAARLAEAGVPVTARRELGLSHGFVMDDTTSPPSAAAGDRIARDLAEGLHAGSAKVRNPRRR